MPNGLPKLKSTRSELSYQKVPIKKIAMENNASSFYQKNQNSKESDKIKKTVKNGINV